MSEFPLSPVCHVHAPWSCDLVTEERIIEKFFLLRSHVWHLFCFVVPDLFARVARPTVSSRLQCMALTAVSARVEGGRSAKRASERLLLGVKGRAREKTQRETSERVSGGRERIGRGERKGDVNLGADGRQEEKQARTVFCSAVIRQMSHPRCASYFVQTKRILLFDKTKVNCKLSSPSRQMIS